MRLANDTARRFGYTFGSVRNRVVFFFTFHTLVALLVAESCQSMNKEGLSRELE